MVPEEGLEPSCHHWRQILSLVRLPFRHSGKCCPYGKRPYVMYEQYSIQYPGFRKKSSSNAKKGEKTNG